MEVRSLVFQNLELVTSKTYLSSSGVQIGDIGSSIGVIGIWTTTVHDEGDPVGMTWFDMVARL